jgi:hypothetical protein
VDVPLPGSGSTTGKGNVSPVTGKVKKKIDAPNEQTIEHLSETPQGNTSRTTMTIETLIEQLKSAGFRVTGGGNDSPSILYRGEMEETVTLPRKGLSRIRLNLSVYLKGGTELWLTHGHVPTLAEIEAFMTQSRAFIRSVS